jgi:hypothetical protein
MEGIDKPFVALLAIGNQADSFRQVPDLDEIVFDLFVLQLYSCC